MANKYIDGNGLIYIWQKIKNAFVQKEDGKGLSSNDYTTTEKNKLDGIETNANKTTVENSLTSTSTTNALSAAQGKALKEVIDSITTDIGEMGGGDMMKATYDTNNNGKIDTAENAEKLGGQAPSYYATTDKAGINKDGLMSKEDKVKLDKIAENANNYSHPASHPASMITGLSKVATSGSYNDLSDKPNNFAPTSHTHNSDDVIIYQNTENEVTLSNYLSNVEGLMSGAVQSTEKGQANGVATLDSTGLIPSTQLPSYVDDIIEGYFKKENNLFYSEANFTTPITGENGKIYINLENSGSYRYSGSIFVPITSSDMSPLSNTEIDEILKETLV